MSIVRSMDRSESHSCDTRSLMLWIKVCPSVAHLPGLSLPSETLGQGQVIEC